MKFEVFHRHQDLFESKSYILFIIKWKTLYFYQIGPLCSIESLAISLLANDGQNWFKRNEVEKILAQIPSTGYYSWVSQAKWRNWNQINRWCQCQRACWKSKKFTWIMHYNSSLIHFGVIIFKEVKGCLMTSDTTKFQQKLLKNYLSRWIFIVFISTLLKRMRLTKTAFFMLKLKFTHCTLFRCIPEVFQVT